MALILFRLTDINTKISEVFKSEKQLWRRLDHVRYQPRADIEIDQQNSALQDQFIIVTENTVLNDNDQEEINGVRNQVNQFLTDQSKAAFKVETKVFKLKPVTISTYELYGSTDNTQSIIDLNAIKDVSFASGPLKILVT